MKIRIEGNSIRLRLRRSEVDQLGTEGRVTQRTEMPGGHLTYSLVLNSEVSLLRPHLREREIRIELSRELGEQWSDSSQVGFEANYPLSKGESLHLLVEKDFVCLDRDPNTQQDQYPNPKASRV